LKVAGKLMGTSSVFDILVNGKIEFFAIDKISFTKTESF